MKLVRNPQIGFSGIEVLDGVFLIEESFTGDLVEDWEVLFPQRFDLPEDHPLYGKRLLPVVPAGTSDLEVNNNGEVVSAVVQIEE